MSRWKEQICKSGNQEIEPIDVYFPNDTAIVGIIKSNDGKINGRITYARILIRRK